MRVPEFLELSWWSLEFGIPELIFWLKLSPVSFSLQSPHFRVFRSALQVPTPTGPLLTDPRSSVLRIDFLYQVLRGFYSRFFWVWNLDFLVEFFHPSFSRLFSLLLPIPSSQIPFRTSTSTFYAPSTQFLRAVPLLLVFWGGFFESPTGPCSHCQ